MLCKQKTPAEARVSVTHTSCSVSAVAAGTSHVPAPDATLTVIVLLLHHEPLLATLTLDAFNRK